MLEIANGHDLDVSSRAKHEELVDAVVGILDALDELPEAYSDDLFDAKCEAVYEHVYESYHGDGGSTYAPTP